MKLKRESPPRVRLRKFYCRQCVKLPILVGGRLYVARNPKELGSLTNLNKILVVEPSVEKLQLVAKSPLILG